VLIVSRPWFILTVVKHRDGPTRRRSDHVKWQEQGSYQVTAALSGEHRPPAEEQADKSNQRHKQARLGWSQTRPGLGAPISMSGSVVVVDVSNQVLTSPVILPMLVVRFSETRDHRRPGARTVDRGGRCRGYGRSANVRD